MPKLREVNGRKNGPRKVQVPVKKTRKRLHAFTCITGEDGSTVILLPQYDVSNLPEGGVETAAKALLLRHPNHAEIVKPLRDEAVGKRILLKDGFAITLDAECAAALRRFGATFVGFFRHDTTTPSTKKTEHGPLAPAPSMYPELCSA